MFSGNQPLGLVALFVAMATTLCGNGGAQFERAVTLTRLEAVPVRARPEKERTTDHGKVRFLVPCARRLRAPNADTPAEWRAWFGELGSALVDVGTAVTEYTSLGEVGGTHSWFCCLLGGVR